MRKNMWCYLIFTFIIYLYIPKKKQQGWYGKKKYMAINLIQCLLWRTQRVLNLGSCKMFLFNKQLSKILLRKFSHIRLINHLTIKWTNSVRETWKQKYSVWRKKCMAPYIGDSVPPSFFSCRRSLTLSKWNFYCFKWEFRSFYVCLNVRMGIRFIKPKQIYQHLTILWKTAKFNS